MSDKKDGGALKTSRLSKPVVLWNNRFRFNRLKSTNLVAGEQHEQWQFADRPLPLSPALLA